MAIRERTQSLPQEPVVSNTVPQLSAGDLNLSPIWFQREVDGSKRYEKHYDVFLRSLINAWLDQHGTECPKCGREMKIYGKPKEIATLAYITSLNDEGDKSLKNVHVICGECSQE